MEIQETTNFLQRLLNFRQGGSVAAFEVSEGFADMLQNGAQTENVAKKEMPASLREEIRVDDNVKDKNIAQVQKDGGEKEPVREEPVRREDKDKKNKKIEEKASEEESSPALIENKTQSSQTTTKDNSAAAEDLPRQDGKAPAAGQTTPDNAAFSPEGQKILGVVLPMIQNVDSVAETGVEVPLADKSAYMNEAAAKPVATSADVPAQLTAEDALLLEQAQILDKKIAPDGKIKIEVSIEEAKIAAPVAKDVLQNRFEIDSLFQSVDAETVLTDAEFGVQVDAEASVAVNAKNSANMQPNPAMLKGVAALEVQTLPQHTAKEAVTHAATDNVQVLTASGKGAVFESANTARTEAFTRLNETSSRDVFKGMGKEVVEQIKVNITKSAVKGVDTIDIQLKPEDLGKIQVKMHIAKDGRLHADIIVSRPETIDMLQRDISGLEKAFNDAGYNADSRSFNFSFQNENQTGAQQKADAGRLQFIGDALEQEAEGAAGNDNLVWDPVLGLNIKV